MGLFKTKEEKEAIRQQKAAEAEELARRIQTSPMTFFLQDYLKKEFGDLNAEAVNNLRSLYDGCYKMTVQKDGIVFELHNWKGSQLEILDKWAIVFDALGYADLPYDGVRVLDKILQDTLSDIPHLHVNNGIIRYKKNREKQSW